MMKTMKYATPILLALGAILMLTACSNDSEQDSDSNEIRLLVGMENTIRMTRAAHNLQLNPQDDYEQFGVFVFNTGYTAINENYGQVNIKPTGATDNTTNKKLEFTPALHFPISGGNVDVYVYAPWADGLTNVAAIPFTVAADQTTDANFLASDFVFGKATAVYTGDKTAAVTMHHALTKLTFKIDDVGNGTDASGVTAINLLNIFKKVTVDMTAELNNIAPWLTKGYNVTTSSDNNDKGNISVADNTDGHLYDHVRPQKLGDGDEIGSGVSAIIPAQSLPLTEGGPKVAVTIDGKTKDAFLGSSELLEYNPGYEYVYTLNIKSQDVIIVAVSITPWVTDTQYRDLDFTPDTTPTP